MCFTILNFSDFRKVTRYTYEMLRNTLSGLCNQLHSDFCSKMYEQSHQVKIHKDHKRPYFVSNQVLEQQKRSKEQIRNGYSVQQIKNQEQIRNGCFVRAYHTPGIVYLLYSNPVSQVVLSSILEMEKMRPKEVKEHTQGHTANKQQNEDSSPGSLALEPG